MPIAIDLGTRYMHLVVGSVRNGQVMVKNAVCEPIPSGLMQDGIIREFGGMELALKNVLQKHEIKDRSCILTINGNHIYSRDLAIPKNKPKTMQDMVTFEVQSSMNTTKEVVVEYVPLPVAVPDRPDMIQVRASAILLEYVNDYHKLLKNCRLSPTALDIHPNAIVKAISKREVNDRPIKEGTSILVLDIGGVTTTAYILSRGMTIYSRIIPSGGIDLERYVTNTNEKDNGHLDISRLDLGLDNVRKNPDLADAARPLVTTIKDSVQRILQYLTSRVQNERVEQIFIFGRAATYAGFDKTLSETFELPTETIQKLSQIIMPANEPIAPYINAIGALIRQD